MAELVRISPSEARKEVKSGALLVCAYSDEGRCNQMRLEGSITMKDFQSRQPSKDQEIIFYCD